MDDVIASSESSGDTAATATDHDDVAALDPWRELTAPPGALPARMLHAVRDAWQQRRLIQRLVRQQLALRYHRAVLGWLWSMLAPLGMMVVLGVVFGILFKRNLEDYFIFLLAGMLPYEALTVSIVEGSTALLSADMYIRRVPVPLIVYPLKMALVAYVHLLLSFVPLLLALVVIEHKVTWSLALVPLALLTMLPMMIGASLLFATATVALRDLQHIMRIAMRALFYATPILYDRSMLPEKWADALAWNPLTHIVELFQVTIYLAEPPPPEQFLIATATSLFVFTLGLAVHAKFASGTIYRL